MKRRMILVALVLLAGLGFATPGAEAHTCGGLGTLTTSSPMDLTTRTVDMNLFLPTSTCGGVSSSGTITGSCSAWTGTAVTADGHAYVMVKIGPTIVVTGGITGTVTLVASGGVECLGVTAWVVVAVFA